MPPKRTANTTRTGLKSWQFKPGQSGNPSGRPKSFGNAIREKTQDGKELVDLMVRVMRGEEPGSRLSDRMAAASWLSDRGWGKPTQVAELSGPNGGPQEHRYLGPDLSGLSTEELREWIEVLKKPQPELEVGVAVELAL